MPDTPIQFESEAQFHDLPGYAPAMDCTTEELDRIVGKYSWDKPRSLRCGLNRCNTTHWNGYVIAARDGRKTHCGHECGLREFGVKFADVEAAYKRAEVDAARAANIADALRQRDDLLANALAIDDKVAAMVSEVREVTSLIGREPAMLKALFEALRNGGRVQKVVQVDREEQAAMGQARRDFLVADIGRIDAGDAVHQQRDISARIKANAVWPLKHLTPEQLGALDSKALAKKSAELTAARQTIQDGENFVVLAARFVAPSNRRELAKLAQALPKSAQGHQRVAKILSRLLQETTVA